VTKGGSPGGTLESGDPPGATLRLFLALLLPGHAAEELARWRDDELLARVPERFREVVRPVEGFHVTLAFLGSRPHAELPAIIDALREGAAESRAFELVPKRYRETRSVGMVVLDDPSGEATTLAERVHGRLEELGVYEREARPWLPHATVVRFSSRRRDQGAKRPRLAPAPPELGPFVPSGAAAFVSRLHPSGARYEILETAEFGPKEELSEEADK
jgi:RNA 2',3'-cyclic 3'-phosphodiesterase